MTDNLENKTEKGNGEIAFTNLNSVICPIKKRFCELRGNYFKCYFQEYKTCTIYKSWEDKKHG